MSRLGKFLGGSASRLFVGSRGVSSVLALLLALTYAKLLGLEKRSVLAFIMVSALILTIIFTSGFSLGLRNKSKQAIKNEEFVGYIIVVFIASLIVGSINCLLLLTYSNLKTSIPFPIFVVCFIYSSLACFTLGLQDALLAAGNLKTATIFDITTILIQILVFSFLVNVAQTSLIVSIFLSFIFSYSMISFGSLAIFFFTLPVEKDKLVIGLKTVLTQSRKKHLFGIATGLADRLDRFLIGLILPITFLAKYALLSSIIFFARFLPDSAMKINLMKHHKKEPVLGVSFSLQDIIYLTLAGLLFVGLSQTFISYVFGNDWLLPNSLSALIVGQEVLRGIYQSKSIKLIALGDSIIMSKFSSLLITLSLSLMPLFIFVMGIWGAPLAMILNYTLLILLLNNELRKEPHGY